MAADDRPQARLPSGFIDASAVDVVERQSAIETILDMYRLYGFTPLETPAIEYLDALGKNLPDEDVPDEGVFALRDDDEQWIALRYDLTAPLAPRTSPRTASSSRTRSGDTSAGRSGGARSQGRDASGSSTNATSTPSAARRWPWTPKRARCSATRSNDSASRVTTTRCGSTTARSLNGVLARSGVADAGKQLEVLRAVDKLDRLGRDGVRDLLGEGRKDPSGDFTEGARLTDEQAEQVMAFVSAGDPSRATVLDALADLVGDDATGREGIDELAAVADALDAMAVGSQVVFEPTVVRGLAYYTGPVFEAVLTFETLDEKGRPRQFGSVAGGGRYDDLVRRFTGQDVPRVRGERRRRSPARRSAQPRRRRWLRAERPVPSW